MRRTFSETFRNSFVTASISVATQVGKLNVERLLAEPEALSPVGDPSARHLPVPSFLGH